MAADADLLPALLAAARAAGADAADAVLIGGTSLGVQRRLGQTEHVERSESRELGLRAFVGRRAAIVSSSVLDPAGFAALAERAVAMARVLPEDPHAGLAAEMVAPPADAGPLDLDDPGEPDVAALLDRAAAAEDAALATPGITNTEGAEAGFGRIEIALATSAGFLGQYRRSSHSVAATALAGSGTGMQRDYDYASAVHAADLEDGAAIGRRAAERALARLDPARPATATVSVVYDPRVAGGLVGHLLSAINGASVARGTSFLRERMGARVFAAGITIRDDPHRVRGPRSTSFDGEGVPTAPRDLIADGVLTTWLLDSRSARQLGLRSTGHAGRGTGGPPSPGATNVHLAPGTVSPAALIADIRLGLYVTELIGMGVNGVTGDYSRGAVGFMIRDGAIAEPVAEITVAGNLVDMFGRLVPADDLQFRRAVNAPTVRIDGMTMAGA
jgi:PmbA protein